MESHKLWGCGLRSETVSQLWPEGAIKPFLDAIIAHIKPGAWILLHGDLGAGKTTFVKELVQTLAGVTDVTSPTFPVLNVIDLPRCLLAGVNSFVHLDLYRLKSARELIYLGIENQVCDSAVVLVEWPEVVDEDEWADFFETTRCPRPDRIVSAHISHVPGDTSSRRYEFSVFER
jgi:tRNA threonylcarbamoyladenosine biosynthesis protein TsaE